MSVSGWEQLLFIVVVTAVLAPLLGRYLAATFRGAGTSGNSAAANSAPGDRVFLPIERQVYRILGVDPESSWTWRAYALAVLAFGMVSILLLYGILRLQGVLPGTRRTPQGCHRSCPSTRPSASSPAPTGRHMREKRWPATWRTR